MYRVGIGTSTTRCPEVTASTSNSASNENPSEYLRKGSDSRQRLVYARSPLCMSVNRVPSIRF